MYVFLVSTHMGHSVGGRPKGSGTEEFVFDLNPPVNESSEGWELSGVLPCENPLSEVQYRDASEDFGYTGEIFDGLSTEGGMALRQKDGIWWLWQIVPPTTIQQFSCA